MGIDTGFDFYPPLTNSQEDQVAWERFFNDVKRAFQDDDTMIINRKGSIEFTVGEHPSLPKDGYRFRRFSSKITGSHAGNVTHYLRKVENIAKKHFEVHIHPWNEATEGGFDSMVYDWEEVYEIQFMIP
ncbi:hypothetical protein BDN70DRAFT_924106 [Pholiota conissans]|uniref:Uncharacterized protein n=1 Tax=Pholiota conissans TaxID=109636 RepID=A0A9P6CPZ4_9AGAR|nr:hypothetical protein BDN70DRAFT_924106 [Pholiota conissans]